MTKFEEVKRPKKAYIDPFSKRDVDFTGVAKKFTEGAQTLKEWKEYAFLLEDKLKLQQQALPVVPECVAEWYEEHKDDLEHGIYSINVSLDKTAIGELTDVERWFNDVSNEPNETIFIMKRLGYQVEKPQLFYLKNKITGMYLSSDGEGLYEQHKNHGFKFTQEDINSLDTGSYEQIEVTE